MLLLKNEVNVVRVELGYAFGLATDPAELVTTALGHPHRNTVL